MTSLAHIQNKTKILLILPAILVLACETHDQSRDALVLSGLTMGTTYTVKINSPGIERQSLTIKQSIDQSLDSINQMMSTYIPDSDLSKFNKSDSTDWISIPDELFKVIKTAIDVGQASNGAFDITVGPLVNLWGFGPVDTNYNVPDESSIQSALANVNFRYIHLDNERKAIKKDLPGVYIDLSGIAKGYAVDRIASLLENRYDLRNYMVEIGGEIRARGINTEGHIWRIGIELPLTEERAAGQIISLDNMGMATSGDYRNFIEVDDVVYSHTIDPETGRPVTHRLNSVTVIHPQSMVADAWSTALLVTGPDVGLSLADQYGLPAFFIVHEKDGFKYVVSKKFKTYLTQ